RRIVHIHFRHHIPGRHLRLRRTNHRAPADSPERNPRQRRPHDLVIDLHEYASVVESGFESGALRWSFKSEVSSARGLASSPFGSSAAADSLRVTILIGSSKKCVGLRVTLLFVFSGLRRILLCMV